MKKADILVLDFGSQYTQLIARRLREQGVYAEILPFNVSLADIKAKEPKGIILSGGPASVYATDAYFCDKEVFNLGLPILEFVMVCNSWLIIIKPMLLQQDTKNTAKQV